MNLSYHTSLRITAAHHEANVVVLLKPAYKRDVLGVCYFVLPPSIFFTTITVSEVNQIKDTEYYVYARALATASAKASDDAGFCPVYKFPSTRI